MPRINSIANPDAPVTLLSTGLLAGTLDIMAACTKYYLTTGNNPVRVLKFIASAVFGDTALNGGPAVAVWGLVLHYMIAFIFTTFFFLIYPLIPSLAKNKWITAVVFGTGIWGVMNLLVLPLTKVKQVPVQLMPAIISALILIVMIGIPVTWMVGKYYSRMKPGMPEDQIL